MAFGDQRFTRNLHLVVGLWAKGQFALTIALVILAAPALASTSTPLTHLEVVLSKLGTGLTPAAFYANVLAYYEEKGSKNPVADANTAVARFENDLKEQGGKAGRGEPMDYLTTASVQGGAKGEALPALKGITPFTFEVNMQARQGKGAAITLLASVRAIEGKLQSREFFKDVEKRVNRGRAPAPPSALAVVPVPQDASSGELDGGESKKKAKSRPPAPKPPGGDGKPEPQLRLTNVPNLLAIKDGQVGVEVQPGDKGKEHSAQGGKGDKKTKSGVSATIVKPPVNISSDGKLGSTVAFVMALHQVPGIQMTKSQALKLAQGFGKEIGKAGEDFREFERKQGREPDHSRIPNGFIADRWHSINRELARAGMRGFESRQAAMDFLDLSTHMALEGTPLLNEPVGERAVDILAQHEVNKEGGSRSKSMASKALLKRMVADKGHVGTQPIELDTGVVREAQWSEEDKVKIAKEVRRTLRPSWITENIGPGAGLRAGMAKHRAKATLGAIIPGVLKPNKAASAARQADAVRKASEKQGNRL